MDRLIAALVALPVGLVIVAISILPFLTPAWVGFEQGRAEAAAWTGFSETDLRAATDAILHDLVVGPPSFDVAIGGVPVLDERERSHMRDVRGVFSGVFLVAGVAALVLAIAFGLTRGQAPGGAMRPGRRLLWQAAVYGGKGVAAVVAVGGVIVAVAFDAAFEIFHRIFFPAGTYTFDPTTERLVQLFPDRFWSETSIAVGVVMLTIGLGLAFVAGRRLRAGSGGAAS